MSIDAIGEKERGGTGCSGISCVGAGWGGAGCGTDTVSRLSIKLELQCAHFHSGVISRLLLQVWQK